MESNHTVQSRLLDDVVESASNAELPVFSSKYYTLPYLRFINVVRVILFLDVISLLILWFVGVTADEHFIENIVHFDIKSTTFDLAMLATTKIVLLIILYSKLEDTELNQIEEPFHPPHTSKKKLLYLFLIIVTLLSGIYPVAKGSLILYFYLTDDSYSGMCLMYNILTISAVTFGLIEMALLPYCPRAMRKVKVIYILHRLNDSGQEVDDNGEVIKGKANLARVIRLAKPETNLILIAIVSLFVSCGAQTAAPYFFGAVIDAAQRSMDELNRTVVILLIVYAIGSVAAMIRAWLFTLAGQRLVARLRKQLFSSIIQQEIAFFDTNRTGELTNRLSSDTQVVQNAITVNLSMLARYLLQIIGSLIFMFILNAALTGVLLAVVPIISLGAVRYGYYVKDLRQMFQDRLADASTQAEESISSIRTVRSFVGETKSDKDYGFDIDRSYQVGKKLALVQGVFGGVIGMFAYAGVTLVLWYGGKLVFDGVVSAGTLTSFLLYTLQVALAFGLISAVYGEFMQAVGASIRIFDLIDRIPKVPLKGGEVFPDIQGSIEFKNVRFTYPSRPDTEVLKGVNFKVSPGEMVALVGPSGGGKSTIVSLIERFYDPDSGSILLGGHDLTSLDPQWYRTKLAIVSQEPTLFACSIKDNIGYGLVATEDQVVEMAKKANAHDFIMEFEQQYDTTVGERGVRLSGGQKQRVAIARALIINPRILLLDEATSALDAESEHLVQEAVDRAMINRTVLVVAHRLSTVRNASKVIVIDKGEIAESGTHEELLALDGVYKRLVLRQLMAGNTSSDILSTQPEPTEDSKKTLPHISL